MRELYTTIPDPDVVLALEPEELGAQILLLLCKRVKRTFALAGILQELRQMNVPEETG